MIITALEPQRPPYYRYTLIFLTRSNGKEILMLRRRNPPNQGQWNGVGGRLEPGESPLAGALREVREETGYRLDGARFGGLLTWEGHTETAGGLFIYTAPVPADQPLQPQDDEGELAWKTRDWVVSSGEVVNNIPYFGPPVLDGAEPRDYHFVYEANDQIVEWQTRPLPADLNL